MSMSNEQIERHIESLIALQALSEEKIAKLTDATLSLVNVVQHHDNVVQHHDAQIAGLIESQKETARQLKTLRDAGKETDERLKALILLFDRSLGRDKSQ
jgi:hypothetical protein